MCVSQGFILPQLVFVDEMSKDERCIQRLYGYGFRGVDISRWLTVAELVSLSGQEVEKSLIHQRSERVSTLTSISSDVGLLTRRRPVVFQGSPRFAFAPRKPRGAGSGLGPGSRSEPAHPSDEILLGVARSYEYN